jgi:hypothetical protein
LFVLLLPGSIRAQFSSADVLGTVTDATGAVLTGATVTIKNTGTGITRTAETSKTGEYLFTPLQIGTYEVTVEAKGFRKYVAKNITLTAGDRARVDAKMTVGQASETVSVSAEAAAALQTDSSTVGSEIPQKNIEDVPLSGRNLTDLVLMSAGVQNTTSDSALSKGCATSLQKSTVQAGVDDCRQASGYVVNGQSDLNQNNELDGMDNNDRHIGNVEVKPSIDAIEEVKVQTSLYSAESGRTSGGLVQIVTKSGSNQFKGSLYEYLRNDKFDSWTTWATLKPKLRQNQFGGSLGGPIIKNKTFFFADYEGLRNVTGNPQTNSQIPTKEILAAVASGDISSIDTLLGAASLEGAETLEQAFTAPGATITKIDPVAQNLMKLFPTSGGTATCADGYYCGMIDRTQNSNTFDVRIDQHINDRNTLYGRYSYNYTDSINASTYPASTVNGAVFTPGGTEAKQPEDNLSLDYAHVFRPTLVLDLKAGYTYSKQDDAADDPLQAASILGFNCGAGVGCPANSASSGYRSGLPTISGIGSTGSGGGPGGGGGGWSLGESSWVPLVMRNETYQYVGSVTWTKGTQNIKIGGTWISRELIGAQSQNVYGSMSFSSASVGQTTELSATQQFLMGVTSSKARSFVAVNQHLNTKEPSVYVQDDWRIKSKLTLNLGLRYDLFTPYTEKNGYLSNFDPDTVYTYNGVTYTGVLVSPFLTGAQHSNKYANVPVDYHNIAPRFGFAYSLPKNMVLRGGFGITYYPNTSGPNSTSVNAPFSYSLSCGSATQGGPGGGGGNTINYQTPKSVCADVTQPMVDGFPVPDISMTGVLTMATDPTQYAGEGSINSTASNLQDSYQYQYSLQAQKEWRSNVITVGYVGSLGRHLANYESANVAVDSLAITPANNYGVPFYDLNQCSDVMGNTIACSNAGSVNKVSGASLNVINSYSTSDYNGLQATFLRRSTSGLTTSINYTYSHQINNGYLINENGGQSPICVAYGCRVDNGSGSASSARIEGPKQYDLGNADLDLRHRVSGVLTYQIPFRSSNPILRAVASGWTGNLMGTLQTGSHYTVTAGGGGGGGGPAATGTVLNNDYSVCQTVDYLTAHPGNINPSWCSSSWSGISGETRPNMVCDPGKSKIGNWHRSINEWYNPACFVLQQYDTFGNERRNQLVTPGLERADVSMIKQFNLHENYKLQVRLEGFNVTNHPSYGEPGFQMTNGDYIDPTATKLGAISNSTSYTIEDLYAAAGYQLNGGNLALQGNPSGCISNRTSTTTGGAPQTSPVGCITTTQGNNRQFQFALRLTF